jgi:DNA-binding transcriptional LysR family regulator
LVQRTTRHFAVTDIGMEFHGYCVKMVAEAKAAYERVACARATPAGMIRVSCPPLIGQLLVAPLIPKFVEKNPQVRIALEATERRIDIEENFDLCIRVRQLPTEDSALIMRSLGIIQQVLVASRGFLDRNRRPATPRGSGSKRHSQLWLPPGAPRVEARRSAGARGPGSP